ncbi:MAG: hypothetical protein AUJ92_22220 [Armatimonadetes bacterium CG2_30_59_28]|nr:PIN domain-containing protein [Armatimonadota bacterium]OIO89168.1 MAG: hypothetical protein AUJ92_22220 [Armatimonadetes bacterium CG2_30_59_28]PIU63804.1 MAG: hypothetical protein COS85_14960 [Armatimonadetes bacterium CG07_land_8_20_14_0_80_59_28]
MPTYRQRWRKSAPGKHVVAVLDSSVLISALINRKGMPARILRHLARNRFWLVTSQPLLDEFIEVTHRSSL